MSETLLNEIRAAKPAAPAALRERVRELSAREPAREAFRDRLRFTWGWRRLVLVAPATLVVALVAAGVVGLSRDGVGARDGAQAVAGGSAAATTTATFDALQPERSAAKGFPAPSAAAAAGAGGAIAPSPGQLQGYEAQLSLRVDDLEGLSAATKRAQRIALDHGGSVASLRYDAPGVGTGSAQITLRIPTARVQSALAQLAALGTILGQSYGIDDLQQQADGLQAQIEQTQRRIVQILAQLESASLSAESRVVLQSRLSASKQRLAGLRESLRSTNAEARTATIFLTLTTEELRPEAVGGSRLDDVGNVLAWEGIVLLYVLVVAGPFVLLGVLVWLALRLVRRRETARLLEQN